MRSVVYETMSKTMVQPESSQMTSQHGAYELHTRKARLHARTRTHTPTRAVYGIMSKNTVEPQKPQVTSQYGAYELHAG